MYWMRLIGGTALPASASCMMACNLVQDRWRGAQGRRRPRSTVVAPTREPELAWAKIVFATPGASSHGRSSRSARSSRSSPTRSRARSSCSSRSRSASSARSPCRPRKANGAPAWHRILEGRALVFTVLAPLAVLVGGVAELVPALIVKPAEAVIKGARAAVHAARARGPRHLHPRGLLHLPLADDPPVPPRDAALRRGLDARGLRVRPPVPVGQQAHRPGPRPRGRQVPEPLALPAPDRPARDLARLEHAAVRAPRRDARSTSRRRPRSCTRCARSACPTRTPRSTARRPTRDGAGQRHRHGPRDRGRQGRARHARWSRSSPTCSVSARWASRRSPSPPSPRPRTPNGGAK